MVSLWILELSHKRPESTFIYVCEPVNHNSYGLRAQNQVQIKKKNMQYEARLVIVTLSNANQSKAVNFAPGAHFSVSRHHNVSARALKDIYSSRIEWHWSF